MKKLKAKIISLLNKPIIFKQWGNSITKEEVYKIAINDVLKLLN